jgi:hypothetical protein
MRQPGLFDSAAQDSNLGTHHSIPVVTRSWFDPRSPFDCRHRVLRYRTCEAYQLVVCSHSAANRSRISLVGLVAASSVVSESDLSPLEAQAGGSRPE